MRLEYWGSTSFGSLVPDTIHQSRFEPWFYCQYNWQTHLISTSPCEKTRGDLLIESMFYNSEELVSLQPPNSQLSSISWNPFVMNLNRLTRCRPLRKECRINCHCICVCCNSVPNMACGEGSSIASSHRNHVKCLRADQAEKYFDYQLSRPVMYYQQT